MVTAKGTITVKLVKSTAKCTVGQIATVKGLGLRKMNSTKTLENTPAVRGMIKKIIHMLEITE